VGHIDWGPIISATLSALAAIGTAIIAWLGGRKKGNADAARANADASSLANDNFLKLIKVLQEERVQHAKWIEQQSEKIEEQNIEIIALKTEVASLRSQIADMLFRWRRGDAPPSEPRGDNR
jgi:hypothetical protein